MTGAAGAKPEDQHVSDRLRRVTPALLLKELDRARARARELGVDCETRLHTLQEVRERFDAPTYAEDNKCLYPWYAMRISPYGQVYPCSVNRVLGDIRKTPLQDIWNGEDYAAFRRSLRRVGLFPQCSKCCVLHKSNVISRMLPR